MRVLVAAGGSGGHVYPALAVLEELREMGRLAAAAWVGTPQGIESRILKGYPWIEFYPLPCRGLDRERPWTWPAALTAAGTGLFRAAGILREFRPHVVLGMGGYPSFAPVLAAALLGIPTAIHEQNAHMGLVNRLLSRLATRVFLSFPDTAGAPTRARKVRVTGNPVRRSFLARRKPLPEAHELLVMGGSQGSRILIEAALRAAPALARLPDLHLRLLVGRAAAPDQVAKRLKALGISQAEVAAYTDRMEEALARARLVVARAGATTVAELAAAGRPAILIPWSGAAADHQRGNAETLARAGGCLMIPEKELQRMDLGDLIAKLWRDGERLRRMAQAAKRAARPDAARRVAEELLDLAKGKT